MRVVTLLIAVLALSACGDDAGNVSSGAEALTLKTYQVPEGNANELSSTVLFLLRNDPNNMGSARALGSHQIAVMAPASIHEGVEALIDSATKAKAGRSSRIRFHFWLVAVRPGESSEVTESLAPIQEALLSVSDNLGPATFTRLDYLEQVVRSESRVSRIGGNMLKAHVTDPIARADQVSAALELHSPGSGHIETEVTMKTGETVVLGLVGAESDGDGSGFQAFVMQVETF